MGALGYILAAALLGTMVFFAAVVTPTAFKALDKPSARDFLRALFPRFYVFALIMAVLSGVCAMWVEPVGGGVLLAVALGFGWSWRVLLPKINRAREEHEAGDENAGLRFGRLHRLSVRIFGVQALAIAGVLLFMGGI